MNGPIRGAFVPERARPELGSDPDIRWICVLAKQGSMIVRGTMNALCSLKDPTVIVAAGSPISDAGKCAPPTAQGIALPYRAIHQERI